MIYPIVVPFLQLFPKRMMEPWLSTSQVWRLWKIGHQPFASVGSDSFMLSSPNGNMLWTCDIDITRQLWLQTTKSTDIPGDMIKFYDIYGPNLGSSEGDEWKMHRRMVTSGFTQETNHAGWREAIDQTTMMLNRIMEEGGIVPVLKDWTNRLALHVLNGVMFAERLIWQDVTGTSEPVPHGHTISYQSAAFTVVERLATLFMVPKGLLRWLPGKFFAEAREGYDEWTNYMLEKRSEVLKNIDQVAKKKYKTLLESIVIAGTPGPTQPDARPLPEASILGNIFFTQMAGHETTGNSTAFLIFLLALYPEAQLKIQKELDDVLGDRPKDEWSVEKDYSALLNGYMGAVQKEGLRLFGVVQFVPRRVNAPLTVMDSNGNKRIVPKDTFVYLSMSANFRNPKYWKRRDINSSLREEIHDSPAVDFDPERWRNGSVPEYIGEVPLFTPFGQGARQCPGKGFAQIELTAILATLFKKYSVELVVDDKVLESCKGNAAEAWEKTRNAAMRTLVDGVTCNIAISMTKELPLRIFERL
ncbi:cytochrome P450 [Polyplosphaeria fusca]|uniref:Cytochrome P450 n=1 Tax=Polyplosphaeria fusca TaxID=682080 RepID=A0A9P4QTD9_9PLEO|nr:cytochrome P450 [Polyplosphaeria fusca]